MFEIDDSWDGFEWLVVDDKYNNLFAFTRYDKNKESITAVINFSGVDLTGYKIKIPKGKYALVFNTDDKAFGGSGQIKNKIYLSTAKKGKVKEYFMTLDIPKLTCLYLKKIK